MCFLSGCALTADLIDSHAGARSVEVGSANIFDVSLKLPIGSVRHRSNVVSHCSLIEGSRIGAIFILNRKFLALVLNLFFNGLLEAVHHDALIGFRCNRPKRRRRRIRFRLTSLGINGNNLLALNGSARLQASLLCFCRSLTIKNIGHLIGRVGNGFAYNLTTLGCAGYTNRANLELTLFANNGHVLPLRLSLLVSVKPAKDCSKCTNRCGCLLRTTFSASCCRLRSQLHSFHCAHEVRAGSIACGNFLLLF